MDDFDGPYTRIGIALGTLTFPVVFIGCYIYCIATYGFLLGLGLGWLPSGICAAIAAAVVAVAWPLILAAIGWLAWIIFFP